MLRGYNKESQDDESQSFFRKESWHKICLIWPNSDWKITIAFSPPRIRELQVKLACQITLVTKVSRQEVPSVLISFISVFVQSAVCSLFRDQRWAQNTTDIHRKKSMYRKAFQGNMNKNIRKKFHFKKNSKKVLEFSSHFGGVVQLYLRRLITSCSLVYDVLRMADC